MRTILNSEEVKQIVSEIEAWRQRHVADLEGKPDEQDHWQQAKLSEFEQIAEIEQVECYLIALQFERHKSSFLLGRDSSGLCHLGGFTFYAPDFTHPSQDTDNRPHTTPYKPEMEMK